MKQGIKNVLIFVSGAAVGSGVTTLALRAFYTKFINETLTVEINNQIEEIKQEYKDNLDKIQAEFEEKLVELGQDQAKTDKKVEKSVKKEEKTVKSEVKKKTAEQKKEESVDYTKYSEGKKKGDEEMDPRTQAMIEIEKEITNRAGTTIISFGDYTEENGYNKVTATYYQGDGIFTNDKDIPEPNLAPIFAGLLDKFDDYGEGNSLFLRNDTYETDYELIFDDGCYYGE